MDTEIRSFCNMFEFDCGEGFYVNKGEARLGFTVQFFIMFDSPRGMETSNRMNLIDEFRVWFYSVDVFLHTQFICV